MGRNALGVVSDGMRAERLEGLARVVSGDFPPPPVQVEWADGGEGERHNWTAQGIRTRVCDYRETPGAATGPKLVPRMTRRVPNSIRRGASQDLRVRPQSRLMGQPSVVMLTPAEVSCANDGPRHGLPVEGGRT
jgi:hypothetical protein